MDAKDRFTSRVENYVKYRPGYPTGVWDVLHRDYGLTAQSVIADVGCGTGLLARVFLDAGCRVVGVEPNPEMRAAGERILAEYTNFSSVGAAAEATTLPDASMDFVTVGQAFHWFEPHQARREFQRILQPGGWAVLVWNERQLDSTPFLRDYESLLQHFGTDYNATNHRAVEADAHNIPDFYGGKFQVYTFENNQHFDLAGVRGRLLSSSYTPQAEDARHAPMLEALEGIFERHQQAGQVMFAYTTRLFVGRLSDAGDTGLS